MKQLYLFLLLSFALATTAVKAQQYSKHIIQFKDKNGTQYQLNQPSNFLSTRAIERRTRYKITIDSTDLPISVAYLDSLKKIPNVSIHNVSKWLNQVCIVTTDPSALAKINSFLFVKKTEPVALKPTNNNIPSTSKKFDEYTPTEAEPRPIISSMNRFNTTQDDYYNYGSNAGMIKLHEGEFLHNRGFHGEGIVIAVLDAGFFNYNTNPALDSIRLQKQILGQWDFVKNEESTTEDNAHGFWCLGVIAANKPGKLVGTAPKAKFWLLRTEDVASEYPIEEQNWAVAAEFADSAGADMISSSLGYIDFDDHALDHTYAQRNGNTAISTIGADLAAKKGILVCNSAGNSGNATTDQKYTACPADGDSVLCVGATDINGNIASFSSWGPNGSGKTKPNVVSVGRAAYAPSQIDGNPITLNGTSLSNPNMCGLTACLWQAFPEFNNMEIIDALQKSAHKYNSPDDRFGYGIPNMRKAYEILLQQQIVRNYNKALSDTWIKAFPVPFNANITTLLKAPSTGKASLRLVDVAGRTIEIKTIDITEESFYMLSFEKLNFLPAGVYAIQYADEKNKRTIRVTKL